MGRHRLANRRYSKLLLRSEEVNRCAHRSTQPAKAKRKEKHEYGPYFHNLDQQHSRCDAVYRVLLEPSHLRTLELQSGPIRNDVANTIQDIMCTVEMLGANKPDLQELRMNMSRCRLREDGAQVLVNTLTDKSGITQLDLSCNWFQSAGVRALGRMLVGNTTIERVNLQKNGIIDSAAQTLVTKLGDNSTLRWLDLSHNWIGEDTKAALRKDFGNRELLL